jgi:DNA modification methylase
VPVLHFKGKSAIESHHHSVLHHRLELDAKLSVLDRGEKPSLQGNLIVEGDNLVALKSLLPTYAGKVKCVYIDPPYNTGNEGWVYNDNLTQPQFKAWIGQTVGKEGEDATRHDKWCCMMYPRLQLLHALLSDGGLILMSVDDNEAHNARMLLDEIFGDDQRLGQIVWRTRNTDNRVKTNLSVDHEYVLVYGKGPAALRGRIIDRSEFTNPDDDPRGPYVTDPLTGKATREERPNLHYSIVNPRTGDEYAPDPSRGWITDRAGVAQLLEEDRIAWPPDPATGKPRKKRYLSETSTRMPVSTFWGDVRGQSGADEVDRMLGRRAFAFPKLLEFMQKLLETAGPTEGVFLDCTAGSGTTGEAVLRLNKEDGGRRTFILVQQPFDSKENEVSKVNICRDVTRERIRKAIEGYTFEVARKGGGAETVEVEPLGGSFSYVRVGPPLFGEYRDFGDKLPSFEDLARYVFYTETSRDIDLKRIDPGTGFIGSTEAGGGTSYYLLYTPNGKEDRELSLATLKALGRRDKARTWVIYCEKVWAHPDELKRFADENGRRIRAMLVPFQLK